MEIKINGSTLELVEGDITKQEVDAIVNAANNTLLGGGGVDGAIHRAGGPALLAECITKGGCPTGEAVITTGGRLPAKYVIHTVGPIWKRGNYGEEHLLKSAYANSLKLAKENEIRTIAFPSISTGAYHYPLKEAAFVALSTVIEHLKENEEPHLVRFVLFSRNAFDIYREVLEKLSLSV